MDFCWPGPAATCMALHVLMRPGWMAIAPHGRPCSEHLLLISGAGAGCSGSHLEYRERPASCHCAGTLHQSVRPYHHISIPWTLAHPPSGCPQGNYRRSVHKPVCRPEPGTAHGKALLMESSCFPCLPWVSLCWVCSSAIASNILQYFCSGSGLGKAMSSTLR